jgi:hypothetical protein
MQVADQVRFARGDLLQQLTDTATDGELDEDAPLEKTMRPQAKPIFAELLYPSSCD